MQDGRPGGGVLVACQADAGGSAGGLFCLREITEGAPEAPDHSAVAGLNCVVRHPHLPVAYGVTGRAAGTLHTWSTRGSLRLLHTLPTRGDEPCHVAVHPSGSALVVTNYSSGTVFTVRLDPLGIPHDGGRIVRLKGSGPVPGRQDGPHPHQAVFVPGGELLLVPDLGSDLLRTFRLDPGDASVAEGAASALPAGTGPRHAAVTEDGTVVVTGELAQTIAAAPLEPRTGAVGPWRAVASSRRTGPARNYPGDIVSLSGTGLLYAANRGADTIAIIHVEEHVPEYREEVEAEVRWPQHLALAEGRLLIAGRDSSCVAAAAITASGRLGRPHAVARLPRPVWLAPDPPNQQEPRRPTRSPADPADS